MVTVRLLAVNRSYCSVHSIFIGKTILRVIRGSNLMEQYAIKIHTIPLRVKAEDWLLFVITAGAGACLYLFWLADYGAVGIIITIGILLAAIGVEIKRLHVRSESDIQDKALQAEKALQGYLDDAPLLIKQMEEKVEEAGQIVQAAAQQYQDRAFAPFWDSVEGATKILYQYNVHANGFADIIKDYNDLIGRLPEKIGHDHFEHNFPEFPYAMDQVPVPVKVYDDLKQLVYEAQKDFEFAVIWEHRHTRQVLIGGFETLGQAIGNLQGRINSSVHSLKESLSPKMIGMGGSTAGGSRKRLKQ